MNHFTQTVWCTLKPSPIHGIGVYAIRDIPQGVKVIWQYDTIGTCTLTEEEFLLLPKEIQTEILHRTIFIDGEPLTFLDPNCVTDYRSYMNHSDAPNTDGISTTREVKAGEELTENYHTMGDWHTLTRKHISL